VLEATTRLVESPPSRTLVVFGYPDVYAAGDHVKEILPFKPIALEGLDALLLDFMRKMHLHEEDISLLPEGQGWLVVEIGGRDKAEADARAMAMIAAVKARPNAPTFKLYDDPRQEEELWKVREAGLGATAIVPGEPETWPGWEDSAVDPECIGDYLRELHGLFVKHGYKPSVYGHFGQGCVHCSIPFDLKTVEGLRSYRAFLTEAAELVVKYGGSLSGEHGDGQARGELLPLMFGDEVMEAFRAFKALWDPDGKMNPGKLIDPYPILANLRMGPTYAPPELATHFKFPADEGSFARATSRCVGVGLCRRTEGGTMCPSFKVTREEEHTTRGRAHALFEMLEGDVLEKGWHDEHVKEALDLCLACKGCKADCPVNVDMASYKAEFLSHYYEGRARPLTGYTMGLIMYWARLAAAMPRVVNRVASLPIAKLAGGIDPRRSVPAFADETFQAWWARRAPRNVGKPRLILWVDTFNNHFHPQVAKAAVDVLETAGYQVLVPKGLCCGRPLYDYGFLDKAKGFLHEILDALEPMIQEGLPMVGLEPSCVAVFRDELTNLMPNDENARRLAAQTFVFGEFLAKKARHFQLPKLRRRALVHAHCHHKAVMKFDGDRQVLDAMGLDYELLDDGCCGMAGSFGFEAGEHCDMSLAIGEQQLLPKVRGLAEDALVITDGFSCHEQIVQGTGRRALHLAEVVQLALREVGALGAAAEPARPRVGAAIAVGAVAGAAALAWGVGAWRHQR
jgi:Fe-S oxidoreductase